MIYRTNQDEIICETEEDWNKVGDEKDRIILLSSGDTKLFKKLIKEYVSTIPLRE